MDLSKAQLNEYRLHVVTVLTASAAAMSQIEQTVAYAPVASALAFLCAASSYSGVLKRADDLVDALVFLMKNYNKSFFDTGGIDPASNPGVFNFKKGLNGNLALNGPLWCLGSNFIVQWITRKIIT